MTTALGCVHWRAKGSFKPVILQVLGCKSTQRITAKVPKLGHFKTWTNSQNWADWRILGVHGSLSSQVWEALVYSIPGADLNQERHTRVASRKEREVLPPDANCFLDVK